MRDKRPRCYFSLRSPYSWLACHDLTAGRPDLLDELRWTPYWEPDELTERLLREAGGEFHYSAMPKAKHLYVLQDVRRLAAARGLRPTWPVDREPHWEVPHLAYLVAAELGCGHDFIRAMHRARWELGLDICQPETVAAAAAELGLDPDDLVGAPQDPAVRAAGVAALLDCDRAGVFGVPFYTNGFQKFWGVDRLAAFLDSLGGKPEPVATVAAVPAPVRHGDDGHAGGCG
ncbi:DsbA family protein [Amycolatopsis sp. NPDC000673]|uniref:2-hydroxychromene-2-carboxylate isomerase n=1 Tax=Amycolatopsis TaxID=1813 RepID=UPI0031E05C9F